MQVGPAPGRANLIPQQENQNYIQSPGDLGARSLGGGYNSNEKILRADGSYTGGESAPGTYYGGFDDRQPPSWSKWEPAQVSDEDIRMLDVDKEYLSPAPRVPDVPLTSLDKYKILTNDDAVTIALKADDLISSLTPGLVDVATQSGITGGGDLTEDMMNTADMMSAATDVMYGEVDAMYAEIDAMQGQLDRNYDTYDNSEQSMADSQNFNAQSAAMAQRVAGMRKALAGMSRRVESDIGVLDGMFNVLEEMSQEGKQALDYYDKFGKHVKDAAARFDAMSKDLEKRGLGGTESVAQARQYLNNLQNYVKGFKPSAGADASYLEDIKKYLQDVRKYLEDVAKDFVNTDKNLEETEIYFAKAKVGTDRGDMIQSLEDIEDAPGPCAAAESDKPLDTLQQCAKDCRTVCRWKEEVGGIDCYECPSGSPDTCYDVKAWPDNHPWCQPGGVCHSDPMMYCVPFGTIGPNLEKLSCTNCKKRDDMCWQKVGEGTMTLTNCKLGCWDGKCVFKGKYQEAEWDGTPEFIHCYKCETPPGPPSCEDMGWGTTWKSDCEKNCPDGQCESVNMKVPGAVPPPPVPPPGGQPGGQCGGGQCGGAGGQPGGTPSGGSTRAGGGSGSTSGGGGGSKPNPPTGTPTQPNGGGSIAGGEQPKPADGAPSGEQPKSEPTPRQTPPTSTQPRQPEPPKPDKPKPPDNPPPPPPDTQQISFYRQWLTEIEARMKKMQEILDNPNEGESVKKSARQYLDNLEKDLAEAQRRIEEELQKELEKQRQAEEAKKREDAYQRSRPRVDYAKEAEARGKKWKLDRLKEATDQLKAHLEEMKQVFEGRRQRLQRIDDEIARLERENKAYKDAEASGRMSENTTRARTTDNTAKINELKKMKAELTKKLQEAQRQYNAELERLRSEYQKRYWQVDEGARRRAEAQRIDEYGSIVDDLRRRQEARRVRNETFNQMAQNLENAIKDKESRGEDADDLRQQLENLKRGQAEWDTAMQKQEDNLKEQLYQTGQRNFSEGAGPWSEGDLADTVGRHAGYLEKDLAAVQKAIADIEAAGGTRTPQQEQQLNDLKSKVGNMQSAIDGLRAREQELRKPYQLSAEDTQRIHDSATRVAAGAMNTGPDPSFFQLAAESLAEEAVNNMNPFTAAKKSAYFALGVAEGVGSAVKGLADLGYEAIDTLGEAIAVDLGFEDGGIFGTDNLDTINSLVSGVANNANFDGVLKAVVAAGGAIDAKIRELERSGDIDAATARFGGRVAGEVVGEVVTDKGLGAVAGLLTKADDVVDAGRAAGKVDDALDAGRAGSRAGGAGKVPDLTVPDAGSFPDAPPMPGVGKVDDVADAGRTAGRGGDAPAQPGHTGGTQTRPTPDAAGPDVPDAPNKPKIDQPTAPRPGDNVPGGLAGKADDVPGTRRAPDGPDGTSGRPRSDRPTRSDGPDRPDRPDVDRPTSPEPDAPSSTPDADAPAAPGAGQVDDAAAAAGKVDNAPAAPAQTPDAPGQKVREPDAPASPDAGKVREPDIKKADLDAPPAPEKVPDLPDGASPLAKRADDVPQKAPGVETPPQRGPPPARPFDNRNTLPDAPNKPPPKQLDDAALKEIKEKQGFREDHAQRMNEFAQEKDAFLLVRDGNPDSVKYFDDPDMMAKPMSSKAKTAKVGPQKGLVVDPTHPSQVGHWDDAIKKAEDAGDVATANKLKEARTKALDSWKDYGDEMLQNGYRVNKETGVIEYVEKLPDGTEQVVKGIHGDYDLHGVYRKTPDGGIEQVSFGEGRNVGPDGKDISGSNLRQQLNDKLTGGNKDMVLHGGQDDWIPDPAHMPNKPPDPPVTVFFPDGRPPAKLKNAAEMKDFYENTMGVKWPYPDPSAAKAAGALGDAAHAAHAADALGDASQAGKAAGMADNIPGSPKPLSGAATPQGPPAGSFLGDDIPTAPKTGRGTGMADDLTAPPPAGGAPPASLTPNANTGFKTPDGQQVPINTGEQLGRGSTSSAYVNANNPKEVIRVTDIGGDVPQAPKLDQAGRSAVESVQGKLGDNSPIRIVEQKQRYVVDDPSSPLHNKVVEVVERAEQGSAKNVLSGQGGVMSDGQARAFDQATRALNEQGYAWLDNHSGNYTFENVPGGGADDWRVVVIDPGGVVPMKGSNLAEKAANARAIQSRVNNPAPDFKEAMKYVEKGEDKVKLAVLAEERGFILNDFGDKIDVGAMGLTSPDQVGFNPGGLIKHQKVSDLFTLAPDEAAKFYGK